MVNRRIAGLVSAAALWAAASPASANPCADRLLPRPGSSQAAAVTARALVELRDFGRVDTGVAGAAPFSVSPDGAFAALILRRADPERDSYCMGVVLIALDAQAPPRLLDLGGEIMLSSNDIRGVPDVVNGSVRSPAPLWSPDGRAIAYLRRDHGSTQVWRVGLDGGPARQLTRLAVDVRDFSWSADGKAIRVTSRPARAVGDAAIEREGRSGFLYDRRFWTLSDDRPRPPAPIPVETILIDAETGIPLARPAAPDPAEPARPSGAVLFARSPSGLRAWTAPADPALFAKPAPLHVEQDGKELACPPAACGSQVEALWWRGPSELLFMRSGGSRNGGRLALFRWRISAEPAPALVFDTDDALLSCELVQASLICARESAVQPRTLVRIDPDTGHVTTLYDPNPQVASLRLGAVERLTWTDPQGVPSYGDLVLPPDHKPGERHPLIIVQYQSEGFLRGGTGDEYPIQLFASRGYAVLSVQRPWPAGLEGDVPDANAMQRANVKDWADRRRILAGVEAGIDAAIARGVVDPDRIGITGLSDGAATVQFALLNSRRIRAAAVSSCCEDQSATAMVGLAYGDTVEKWGYPAPGFDDPAFWRPYSLVANAARVRTPLLIQVADSEYRMALETFAALDYAQAPVEMYVFPNEHHVKSHPAHRLAIYQRNLAWFDFWLRGIVSGDPASAETMRRWQALKAREARP
jgi:dipeptidyl aminopeptidase/acylaminoacyl peptidase